MASYKSQTLLDGQLQCVLERANPIQYNDSFIKHGQCDILKLSKETDKRFKEIREKDGMQKKPIHVRQFKKPLHEWVIDRGKYKHLPSNVTKAVDCTLFPAARTLTSSNVFERCRRTPYVFEKHTKEQKGIKIDQSGKKEFQQQTKTKHTQSEVKDQKQHGLIPYYDELLHKTVLDKKVLDNLISRCILMIEDREEIIKPITQPERNKVLLDILTERPYGTFQVFKDVLKASEPNNSCVQNLCSRMQCTESSDEHISCHDISVNAKAVTIQMNYKYLVNRIDSIADVTDYLLAENVLEHEDLEEVCASSLTKNESNRRLLEKLLYKDTNAYTKFKEALTHAKNAHVVKTMSNTVVTVHEQTLCQIGLNKFRDRQTTREDTTKGERRIHTQIEEKERTQDEAMLKNILEQFEGRLTQWEEDDKNFVSTKATNDVLKHILTESCVTLIGNSGTGKSFISHHVALALKKQGYTIIPCDVPGDIRQWFQHGRKTLFVFDDVCGKFTVKQQIYNDWTQRLDHIIYLLKDKCCKIMATCRLDLSKEEQFSSLSIFKACKIDLSSEEYRLNAADKIAFAEVYFKDNADKITELSDHYDFFPLLCSLYNKQNLKEHVNIKDFFSYPFTAFKNELEDMYTEGDPGKIKFSSLVLCVMFNNTLLEENFSTENKKIMALIEDLLNACELNKGTSIELLRKSLERLEGTYIIKEDSTYKILHDKLFDFLANYFGKKMLQLFIKHVNADFINERFIWKAADILDTDLRFAVAIPDNLINEYIDRLLKDWENGFIIQVFTNRNMTSLPFTETFISSVNKLDQLKQEELVSIEDKEMNETALGITCFSGFGNLVEWLISMNSDINHCGEDGLSPLMIAIINGHVEVVKELIQHAADVNQCSKNGCSPLCLASQNGHVNVVKELLKHKADVNACDNDGVSPLCNASQNGHVDVVKELLKHKANANACDNDGVSPLCNASQNGHVDVVKELLKDSADVNKCDNAGESPLYTATYNDHFDVVKELLKHKADVNNCQNDGFSPLCIASENGNVSVVKQLLKHNADVNASDNNGVSPLIRASHNGHIGFVKELLKYSADVNQFDNRGQSPLSLASHNGHFDVVKELLQHEADVNKCDNDGFSPLCLASINGQVDVVKELLQHAANVNKCDNDGVSPLSLASMTGHVDVVKELLQYAADVNNCDNLSHSPLSWASRNGHAGVVKELLKHEECVNKCRKDGSSPLCIASLYGHVDVVKELLKEKADVNASDKYGLSPLCKASQNGRVDVVKELLQFGANVNKCDNHGQSPISMASQIGHVDVVKELLQNSAAVVDHCDNNGVSPLYIASKKGHAGVVKELLKHEACVNKCHNDGSSPLCIASLYGHVDVVKELFQNSAVVVDKCDNDGASPLHFASEMGHIYVLKELLKHEADVNKCSNNGVSPLFIASLHGHVGVVNDLLKNEADVNKCLDIGISPLDAASYNNHAEVSKLLLQCDDVDVNFCCNYGRSSLYWASHFGNVDVVKELLRHSANVNTCNTYGVSPLNIASTNGHIAVVQCLLQHSAEVQKCDNDGISPLYRASQEGHVDVVKELLQYSADVNQCSYDGGSPLLIASYNDKTDVVKVLLQCDDVDINLCDEDGRTSLYWASQKAHVDIVIELLNYSVDVNKCDNDGVSPLHIAQEYKNKEIETLLLEKDAKQC